jgi:steroid delta-isomerase-like uncharacterized protein
MRKTIAALFLISCFFVFLFPAEASNLQSKNKAVARRVFDEILSQGKFGMADQIYAKDFVNHGLHRDASLKEDQDSARGWRLAFPDLKMSVVQEIAEGDLVTVLWVASGTNTGEGNGLPATGKKMEVRGITIWRIVKGKITEEWSAFDELPVMKDLGLLPAPTK